MRPQDSDSSNGLSAPDRSRHGLAGISQSLRRTSTLRRLITDFHHLPNSSSLFPFCSQFDLD